MPIHKNPPIREKPYVLYFNGSTLYYTSAEMVAILDKWQPSSTNHRLAPQGKFMTGLGPARWERRKR